MPWLLASPGHQEPWYWLDKISFHSCLSRTWRRSISMTRTISVLRLDRKCKYNCLNSPQNNSACRELKIIILHEAKTNCFSWIDKNTGDLDEKLLQFLQDESQVSWVKLSSFSWCLPVYARVRHDGIMTWKRFLHYWPFVRESTSHWWITPRKGASNSELLCYLYSVYCKLEQAVEKNTSWVAGDLRCNIHFL